MNKMERNKIIIAVAILLFDLIFLYFVMSKSEYTGILKFRYLMKGNTGQAVSLAGSIIMYAFLWWLSGTMACSYTFLFYMIVYKILHRNEKLLKSKIISEDFYFGVELTLIATYSATAFVILLHISNLFIVRL